MILEVKSLSSSYNSGFNLANISFNLRSGQTLVVRGHNGSGKSTLLRTIVGLGKIDKGNISIDDVDVTNDLETRNNSFSYLGHLNGLDNSLTVIQNLRFWRDVYNEKNSSVVDELGLSGYLGKRISECSSGQKRMIGLARVFNSQRKILLLDEPTVGLDNENTKIINYQIEKHKSRGGMAIIVTHETFSCEKEITLERDTELTSHIIEEKSNIYISAR